MIRILIRASLIARSRLMGYLRGHGAFELAEGPADFDADVLLVEADSFADTAAREGLDWAISGGPVVLLLRDFSVNVVGECQLLAERKHWTMDELADRTIPTAGFDETATMEFDYGVRKFTAKLAEDMSIVVTNAAGKVISSLPDANKSDDEERAKLAKASLSASRKELKSVLSMQRDRLYEAMCTQRDWTFEEWETYLAKHPVVGRYCQRLVWVVWEQERAATSFRPLPDGTLTNTDDDEVKVDAGARIRLGHDVTVSSSQRDAWVQHFSDYGVDPLFQQFGKPAFAPSEEQKSATEITDFLGHAIKAFSLRNRLTRLGYTRGVPQDGGWFFDYHKSFIGLGLESVIEFTGNGLPEQNRDVALRRLYFARKGDANMAMSGLSGMSGDELSLGELPPVLLSECWNDIRLAAAEGAGFAKDWEKQTEP